MNNASNSLADGPFAIRAPRAFDGERWFPHGAVVLCRDGRIVGVEPSVADMPEGWPVHEFAGGTLLPGLIDCHVHLCGDSANGALDRLPAFGDEELDAVIDRALSAQLAAGVTTVRDLGDRRWAVVERRDRAARDPDDRYPTIVASGPPITTPQGHCWHMGGEVEGPDGIREAVRERAERRVDIVKVMASGGAMTPGTDIRICQYSLEHLRLVVDEAHAAGLPVTAHAHGLTAVEQSIGAGVDGIEHCTCLTENGIDLPDSVLDLLVASGIVVCPTLGVRRDVEPPPNIVALLEKSGITVEARRAFVGRFVDAGVDMISGVDAGISTGKAHGSLPFAIAELVAGGATPAAALASATLGAARACGLGERKGTLRAGYDADVLVVDGDPMADITALEHVSAVYLRGQSA